MDMADSQSKNLSITVTCQHCKRKCMKVAVALPTHLCDADESTSKCVWHVEYELDCDSNELASGMTPLSESPAKNGTSVDKKPLHDQNSVGIIIVGRPGAGKTNVVEKGLFHDCEDIKVVDSIQDPQIEILTCSKEGMQYKIVMISDVDCNTKADPEAGWRKLYAHKEKFPATVSLILFVYRYGRFTDEEKAMFHLGRQCFQSASALCATVVTNCDAMTSEAKEKVVADFRGNSNTKELAVFMKKEPGICCVSFPDIDKLAQELQDVYKREFTQSQTALSKLLQANESKMNIDEVFKQPPPQKSGSRFTFPGSSMIPGPWRSQP